MKLHHKISLLHSAWADECRRSSTLENEINNAEDQLEEELEFLEYQREEVQQQIKTLEERLLLQEQNQEELQKLRKELKGVKTVFAINLQI